MSPGRDDYTRSVARWLIEKHALVNQEQQILEMSGLQWGIALAMRHPEYAQQAHEQFTKDFKERLAGTVHLFNAMSAGGGDERTAPEILADQLAEEVYCD